MSSRDEENDIIGGGQLAWLTNWSIRTFACSWKR